jgi:hypothetical protein
VAVPGFRGGRSALSLNQDYETLRTFFGGKFVDTTKDLDSIIAASFFFAHFSKKVVGTEGNYDNA